MSAKGRQAFEHASPERPSSRTSSPRPLGQKAVLILPNGRRSGLVGEGVAKPSEHASPERPSSRTSSLLPSGRRPFLILPNGRRSGLVREKAVKVSKMYRLRRLREHVRSYPSGRRLFLILPNGRRSGLVREGVAKLSDNASPERPSSRTSSLLPSGRRPF